VDRPVLELVRERFSCRTYLRKPIEDVAQARLRDLLERHGTGPFGSPIRLALMAATEEDARAIKGLGTYGTIRNPQGFIVGAVGPGARNLEDFGYLMEQAILTATDIGLGTCWLGGFFQRSRFGEKAGLAAGESVPAVASVGYCADAAKSGGFFGRMSQRSSRLPVDRLFFYEAFDLPLLAGEMGAFAPALEAVRWAPSASNKQPWRIVRRDGRWHFFLRRTKGYNAGMLRRIVGEADLQRIDMGIAMCHFELAASEAGLAGTWARADPGLSLPDDLTSYTATWHL
jgi:nitroreductase